MNVYDQYDISNFLPEYEIMIDLVFEDEVRTYSTHTIAVKFTISRIATLPHICHSSVNSKSVFSSVFYKQGDSTVHVRQKTVAFEIENIYLELLSQKCKTCRFDEQFHKLLASSLSLLA